MIGPDLSRNLTSLPLHQQLGTHNITLGNFWYTWAPCQVHQNEEVLKDDVKIPPSIKPKKPSKIDDLLNAFSNNLDSLHPQKKNFGTVLWNFHLRPPHHYISMDPYCKYEALWLHINGTTMQKFNCWIWRTETMNVNNEMQMSSDRWYWSAKWVTADGVQKVKVLDQDQYALS